MKNFNKLMIGMAFLASVASTAFGQIALSTTTLGAAITTTNATTITLASTSTMLNQGPGNQFNTCLYTDAEVMAVITVIDSTHVLVAARGSSACGAVGMAARPTPHQNSAPVYFAITSAGNPAPTLIGKNYQPTAESLGACTASSEVVLPRIFLMSGDIYDCRNGSSGGQWIKISTGTSAPAGTRVTAFCTGTAGTAETEYLNFAACSGATTLTARQLVTSPGTIANLYVVSSAAFTGGTGKDVISVFKNGTVTTLTCTAVAAATTCSDLAHSVSVVPGDVLAIQFISATSDTAANVAASFSIF